MKAVTAWTLCTLILTSACGQSQEAGVVPAKDRELSTLGVNVSFMLVGFPEGQLRETLDKRITCDMARVLSDAGITIVERDDLEGCGVEAVAVDVPAPQLLLEIYLTDSPTPGGIVVQEVVMMNALIFPNVFLMAGRWQEDISWKGTTVFLKYRPTDERLVSETAYSNSAERLVEDFLAWRDLRRRIDE